MPSTNNVYSLESNYFNDEATRWAHTICSYVRRTKFGLMPAGAVRNVVFFFVSRLVDDTTTSASATIHKDGYIWARGRQLYTIQTINVYTLHTVHPAYKIIFILFCFRVLYLFRIATAAFPAHTYTENRLWLIIIAVGGECHPRSSHSAGLSSRCWMGFCGYEKFTIINVYGCASICVCMAVWVCECAYFIFFFFCLCLCFVSSYSQSISEQHTL